MKNTDLYDENHEATYCPEDNKIRLYVGRVSREEYLALKNEGWKSTPKQDCDFVAVWTVSREDTALSYAGALGDEDQDPAERAADRAERFGGYRDKRLNEAFGHAETYESGPSLFGHQNKGRAAKAADRHDRHATRALSSWDRADYWTHRTEGVIANALHLGSPHVRLGRIKKLESEKRKAEKAIAETKENTEIALRIIEKGATQEQAINFFGSYQVSWGDYQHPRLERKASLYSLLTNDEDPITAKEAAELYLENRTLPDDPAWQDLAINRRLRHLENRLAYENQMIEAEGGAAGETEIKKGGRIDGRVIVKVSKSSVTKKVTSCTVLLTKTEKIGWQVKEAGSLVKVNLDRALSDCYQEPTEESLAILADHEQAEKIVRAQAPKKPQLLNPTDEDAEKLQAIWNRLKVGTQEGKVIRMTQAQYSANSKGSFARLEAYLILEGGDRGNGYHQSPLNAVCKVRGSYNDIVILTDKPQKPLPALVFTDPVADARQWCRENLQECFNACQAITHGADRKETQEAERKLFRAKWIAVPYSRKCNQADELTQLFQDNGIGLVNA